MSRPVGPVSAAAAPGKVINANKIVQPIMISPIEFCNSRGNSSAKIKNYLFSASYEYSTLNREKFRDQGL